MAAKKDNTLLYVGGAILLLLLFGNKNKTLPMVAVGEQNYSELDNMVVDVNGDIVLPDEIKTGNVPEVQTGYVEVFQDGHRRLVPVEHVLRDEYINRD